MIHVASLLHDDVIDNAGMSYCALPMSDTGNRQLHARVPDLPWHQISAWHGGLKASCCTQEERCPSYI